MRGFVVFPRFKCSKFAFIVRLLLACSAADKGKSGIKANLGGWPAGEEQVYVFQVARTESGNQAPADSGEDLNRGVRVQSGQHTERGSCDAEQFARFGGGDACRARSLINQCNFAEEVTRRKPCEFDFPSAFLDRYADVAAEDDIHAMSDVAGIDDTLILRISLDRALLEQGMKLFVAQLREHGELCEKPVIIWDFAW